MLELVVKIQGRCVFVFFLGGGNFQMFVASRGASGHLAGLRAEPAPAAGSELEDWSARREEMGIKRSC